MATDNDSATAESTNLDRYFRDLAVYSVMTKDEEVAAAASLDNCRLALWQVLLGYPPFADAISSLACTTLGDESLRGPAETLATAARQWDGSAKLRRAYGSSCEAFARLAAQADRDVLVPELVVEDFARVEGKMKPAYLPSVRATATFADYCQRVHGALGQLNRERNKFAKANLRLVVTLAKRFHGLPLEDLIQEGNIGLMKAVDRFDHRKGFRFSTYASWWIRHAVTRAIAQKGRAIRLPIYLLDLLTKAWGAEKRFVSMNGREPTDEELSKEMGVPAERIRNMRLVTKEDLSLDQPVQGQIHDVTLADSIAEDDERLEPENLDRDTMAEHLASCMQVLKPIEADILRKRAGQGFEEHTLKEIAEQYGLSRERIRQLQEQALGKLRAEFRRRGLMS